jgi:hypothetical protein
MHLKTLRRKAQLLQLRADFRKKREMPTDVQIRTAETRLQGFGHDLKRVGHNSGTWLLDGQYIDAFRLIFYSKGE